LKKSDQQDINGVLIIHKPEGPTSHDIVARVRRVLQVRTGHTGTLDPMATGVLPILLGRATRLARFYLDSDKEYLATIRLGIETDTYDARGKIVRRSDPPRLDEQAVGRLLRDFLGEQEQLPPIYSAVRVGGKRLYEAARKNKSVERPVRRVVFYEMEMIEKTIDTWKLRVKCSSGTYIRSLAHDIGEKLGCGAHLSALVRTRSGPFTLEQATPPEAIETEGRSRIIPMEKMLVRFPSIELTPDEAARVVHGNPVACSLQATGTQRLMLGDRLIALADAADGRLRPRIVLRTRL